MELMERIVEILKKYDICDDCLGRQFHELNPKIPNKEKGKILRNYAIINSTYKEEKTEFKKNENCFLCNNIFSKIDFYVQEVKKELEKYEYETFLIGSKIPAELVSKEEDFWEENGVDLCEAIKSDFNRALGISVRKEINHRMRFENPDIMAVVDIENNKINLQISPLYIQGSYKKKTVKGKVQLSIENTLLKHTGGAEAVFYSIGRLEQNVITSCYRPFVIMLKNPKIRKPALTKMRGEINKLKFVSVSKLSCSNREAIDELKNEKITASYRITIEFRKKFKDDEIKEVKKKLINLKNRRVLQFLKQKTRNPYIRRINVKVDGKKFIIDVESTVGFSVNSFLDGKSKPNLTKLIGREFKVKEIVLKRYRIMKGHEMYS
ncbi:MAG: hypothetical protein KAT28_01735 [Candidatus Aenigmarchaeota archaeon]|nr:hypothetical protein [Candidatus Aenigmarchaeota archaeon]